MTSKIQVEQAFIDTVKGWTRSERLSVLRAGGFTCHKMTDEQLIEALVNLRRRNLAN